MIFTVTWSEWAEQQLAAIWLASMDRAVVVRASHEIDQTLRVDADTVGRRRSATVRRYWYVPLAVEFEVSLPDRMVVVTAVWELPTTAPGFEIGP
jgi:hypothetical protein